jgi:hypothetical protein
MQARAFECSICAVVGCYRFFVDYYASFMGVRQVGGAVARALTLLPV